ncbi:MAG TPA: MiaB/RimO family radical SAM methylthiotransferase [Candidatus Pacebacteria bacterium]|nr:MiaB/RimO family radical SAM methylthiotransferase [Candidatus Paceibacterota bacterium]
MKKIFIKTFGCQQNVADSERLAGYYSARGYEQVKSEDLADLIVINTCMIRDMAEERVYGYIRNLKKKAKKEKLEQRIVLTGCIVGAVAREPSGVMKKKLEKRIPDVELMPIEEVGFEYEPERKDKKHAWAVISNGCNNYCSFCIVPFARGKEVSRPYIDIMTEVKQLADEGFTSITLLGQNVNSYGSDLVLSKKDKNQNFYELSDGKRVEPIMVNHLGRTRIPTLFPFLLDEVAKVQGIETVTFTSSNPWDFSDELIDVIAQNKNIDRLLHLPVQSGSDKIIKKMNRWYTAESFLKLTDRIRNKVEGVEFVTDIIVGFPGETEEDFQKSVELSKNVGFVRAFIGCYSERPGTLASKEMPDTVEWEEKKRRWHILNELINKPNLGISESKDWIRTREKHSVK